MSTASVYVIRDQNARPLYVGMSNDVDKRLVEHRSTASWWDKAYTVSRSEPMSRRCAVVCERLSILALHPLHNRQWNRRGRDVGDLVTEYFTACFLSMSVRTLRASMDAGDINLVPVDFDRRVGQLLFRFADVKRVAYAIAALRDEEQAA